MPDTTLTPVPAATGMSTRTKVLLWGAVAAVVGGAAWWYWRTRIGSAPKSLPPVTEPVAPAPAAATYESTTEEGGVFTRPVGVTSAPLLIVYGGVTSFEYATKEGMAKAMPDSLKRKVFALFVNYKSGEVASYVAAARRLAQKYGLTYTDTKIMGFSGGGAEILRSDMPSFSFVGLIDPFVTPADVGKRFNSQTHMIYRIENWGGKLAGVRKILPQVAASVKAAGGIAAALKVRHEQMPTAFFTHYEAVLATPRPFGVA